MSKKTILLVDDEWKMRNLLKIHLAKQYVVIEASNGVEALAKFTANIHLVILDIMMAEMDGWEVCERIRKESNVPIIMITARGDIADKSQGFGIGADDYLVKPFDVEELLLRVNALIRRSTTGRLKNEVAIGNQLIYQDLTVNMESRSVKANGSNMTLTPKEYDLLLYLLSNPNKVFTRDQLLDQIWGIHEVLDYRTVDTHIKNIRDKCKKMKLSFNPIKTVWGVGYQFEWVKDSI
ncbi:response regulator transcription factor [Bacillus spongiae]|uniref:Response regulator transcription factor n=1 Tax=Bacillus spongiae TaxID=2683610 RepID=A0ABU8HC12_9BACI